MGLEDRLRRLEGRQPEKVAALTDSGAWSAWHAAMGKLSPDEQDLLLSPMSRAFQGGPLTYTDAETSARAAWERLGGDRLPIPPSILALSPEEIDARLESLEQSEKHHREGLRQWDEMTAKIETWRHHGTN